jgi:dUTP pyrophosphatase
MKDEGKPRLSLIPKSATWAAAEAFTYGANKHSAYSWKQGSHTVTQMLDKALRHITLFQDGIDYDKESSLLHLGHALADIAICVDLFTNYSHLDDRFKRNSESGNKEDVWINEEDHTQMIELEAGDVIIYPDGKESKHRRYISYPSTRSCEVVVKFKKLNPNAIIPKYHSKQASGLDLSSIKDITISTNGRAIIPTGLAIELQSGTELQIRPRSGVSAKTNLTVFFGTIDSDYRGEIGIIVHNTGEHFATIKKGERIAQGVVCEARQVLIEEVTELSETERGASGFGSTNK